MWDVVPRPAIKPGPPGLGAECWPQQTTRAIPVQILRAQLIGSLLILRSFTTVSGFKTS